MQVMLLNFFREITGTSTLTVEASDVAGLLKVLTGRFGERLKKELFAAEGVLKQDLIILVNGRNIAFLDGLETKLKAEDVVTIFPVVAGG